MLLLFILILTNICIVTVHESSHLLGMRLFNFPIEEISIGFGQAILNIGKIRLRIFPFGGFIKYDTEKFGKLPIWQRITIYLAGPVGNIIFGLCALMFFAICCLKYNPHTAITYTKLIAETTVHETSSFISSSVRLKADIKSVHGILGISNILKRQIANGWKFIIPGLGVLNICVGLFQLLPIPIFDGGRVLVDILSNVHPFFSSTQFRKTCAYLSIIIIIFLIYETTYNDVSKIITEGV